MGGACTKKCSKTKKNHRAQPQESSISTYFNKNGDEKKKIDLEFGHNKNLNLDSFHNVYIGVELTNV